MQNMEAVIMANEILADFKQKILSAKLDDAKISEYILLGEMIFSLEELERRK